jgi:hypothetical protein
MPETLQTYNSHAKKESLSDRWLGERRKGRHRRTGQGIMAMLSRMHRSRAEGAGARPATPAQSYEQSLVSLQNRLRESTVAPVVRGGVHTEAQPAPRHAAPESPQHAAPEVFSVPEASNIRPEIPAESASQPFDEQTQPVGQLMAREPGTHYNSAEDVSQMAQRDYDAHRIVQHDNGAVGRHRAPESEPKDVSGWFAGSNTRR